MLEAVTHQQFYHPNDRSDRKLMGILKKDPCFLVEQVFQVFRKAESFDHPKTEFPVMDVDEIFGHDIGECALICMLLPIQEKRDLAEFAHEGAQLYLVHDGPFNAQDIMHNRHRQPRCGATLVFQITDILIYIRHAEQRTAEYVCLDVFGTKY